MMLAHLLICVLTFAFSIQLPKASSSIYVREDRSVELPIASMRIIEGPVWATDAISTDGLSNYNLPCRTTVPAKEATYNGYGKPNWAGNFSLTYPIDSVNRINVTYLPFSPNNYTATLTEGVDYLVHAHSRIELLTDVDMPIINEHWIDGVNTSLQEWAWINYVASGIESIYVKFPNGTERFARNHGYIAPPPSEWWYDPDWPREFILLQLVDFCIECPYDWPAGSEWWVNYTAVSCLTVDYNAFAPLVSDAKLSIRPNALNLQSKGKWFCGHIEFSQYHDVKNIDISTLLLNKTASVDSKAPIEIGDCDNDTLPDLTVSFNRTEITQLIVSENITNGNVVLAATGEPYRINSFNGHDAILVSSLIGDVNCDGTVNIYDIILASTSYHSNEGDVRWNANVNFAPPWDAIDIFDIVTIIYHYGETYR